MNMSARFFGEFMGTAVLILLGNGVVANVVLKRSKAEGAGWGAIAAGWAFAVMCGVFTAIACGSPDAHLNPAVTLGMAIISGDFSKFWPFLVAQLLGAIVGATFVWLHVRPRDGGRCDLLEKSRVAGSGGRSWPLSGRHTGVGNRFVARRNYRVRYQSGSRSGSAHCAFLLAAGQESGLRVELRGGSDCGSAPGSCPSGDLRSCRALLVILDADIVKPNPAQIIGQAMLD